MSPADPGLRHNLSPSVLIGSKDTQQSSTSKYTPNFSTSLSSATHHPKPPKETLRFLPNMVVATGHQNPVMSPGLLAREPWSSNPKGHSVGRATRRGTSLHACPQPQLPVGVAAWPGGVSCTLGGTKAAREVTKGSFPTPRGTHSSGRGSAGRLHHTALASQNPQKADRFSQLCLGSGERASWEPQDPLGLRPFRPLPGAA